MRGKIYFRSCGKSVKLSAVRFGFLLTETCSSPHYVIADIFILFILSPLKCNLTDFSDTFSGNEISEESDDDEEDDDYDPDNEKIENNDNDNNTDAGYDTDELSYDGIEVDDSAEPKLYDSDDESDTGLIELERDPDLECDIDSEEVGQLLSEAGQGHVDALLDSVTVAGRQLRVRTMKEIKRCQCLFCLMYHESCYDIET